MKAFILTLVLCFGLFNGTQYFEIIQSQHSIIKLLDHGADH
ncbi:hypothetical protein SAMN04487970_105526 [Paenibacillus tianmuensis]|uniref:Uncharacterized protein n=1 Tax=Paenibacillus tianmuensis TaxID=624147 RepID=A0A1G4TK32_9BACL|nr:hypothetical protein SAMN04487970_105526 [Paenibacillus tianmuensis]